MASILIVKKVGLCRLVESALLTFAGKVGAALEATFRPFLQEGETMPSFGLVLTLFVRYLRDQREKLSASDISRLDELDGDVEVREDLSQAMDSVRQILINSRETIRHVYGKIALKRFGFQRRTARGALTVLGQGFRVLGNLRDPSKREGLVALAGAHVEFDETAAALEEALGALQALVDEMDVERRKAMETKVEKSSTMDAFNLVFTPLARVVEGLFDFAGFPELARRIRPATRRRPGRTEVDPGELGAPGDLVPPLPPTSGDGPSPGAPDVG